MSSFCVNCGFSLRTAACNTLDLQVRLLLEEWVDQSVTDYNVICMACKQALHLSVENGERVRKLGHTFVCVGCGTTLHKKQFHSLPLDDPTSQKVLSKQQRKVDVVIICHPCKLRYWRLDQKANETRKQKNNKNSKEEDSERYCTLKIRTSDQPELKTQPNQDPTQDSNDNNRISLVNYKRALMCRTACTMRQCKNKNLVTFPKLIVEMFLVDFNIYMPSCVKICSQHLEEADWDTVAEQMKVTETFNREHVEHALNTLKRQRDSAVDFKSVEFMPDSLCKFLTGLKVAEFMELHDSIKWDSKPSKLGLAILLIKLKREPNDDTIAELLGVNYNIIKKELTKAIQCVRKTDKAFFRNLEEESLSNKVNSSFLSIYNDTTLELSKDTPDV